jgi:ATP synthase protein I
VVAPIFARPLRTVLVWQGIATLAVALVSGIFWGPAAALSAVLGGLVNVAAGAVYAIVLKIGNPLTPGGTILTLFRAEASKIMVIVLQLWIVLTMYKELSLPAFFATFVITVLLFRVALLARD